jgi:hypothetical protein
MARIDDFILARSLSRKELAGREIDSITRFSGAFSNKDMEGLLKSFSIRFLNRDVTISWPEMEFSFNDSADEIPIQQQVLILHYLNGACSAEAGGSKDDWISFQDLPEGRFYMDAFIKRAKNPLLGTFGANPKKMAELASRIYNASPMGFGDCSVILKALPMVPVVLVMWYGDDEFAPEGNILFDRGISDIMPAEDIAWLAGMVVYPLVGMANK